MTSRRKVADAVKRAAFAAELKDDPRAKSWSGAAWPISQAEGEFDEWIERGLDKIPGVDATLAELGAAVFRGETPALLTELEADLPEGLFAVGEIKGLGAKKVKALWKDLGISSLGELEYAIEENRLLSLKGFGAKTQAKVAAQIDEIRQREGWMRRDEMTEIADAAREEAMRLGLKVRVAGDYRRGMELSREVVLVVEVPPSQVEGESLVSELNRRRGLRAVGASPDEYGAALVRETGPEQHIRQLEALGELAGADEQHVYDGLGLLWLAPERRGLAPLVKKGQTGPSLVRMEDLRGALHNHTTASDGTASLTQMRDAAAALGLSYLGISEHSQAAAYARGLLPGALRDQRAHIAKLNEEGHACELLSGIESDILEDGGLDYDDALLDELDVVIASVHRRFRQDPQAMTARMCKAAAHAQTCVIGHPTGRLLLSRKESGVDIAALLEACATHGVAIELNANPHRLDLCAEHAAMAKERGVLVSISADAHSTEGLRNLEHGIAIARRAGLRAEDVLNTRTSSELRAWRRGA